MIKVHLILGFLGAGKTTFLKKVLKNPALKHERIMLVVNDYGLENYDANELRQGGVEVIEITNGCLCCSYNNQFEEVLAGFANKKDVDRIFIEPSGLFIPEQVLPAFEKVPLKDVMTLEPIITIVDYALLYGKKLWPPAIERLMTTGQLIVRNKNDRLSERDQLILEKRIRQLNSKGIYDFEEAVEKFFDLVGENVINDHDDTCLNSDHGINYIQISEGLEFKDQAALLSYLEDQTSAVIRAKGNVLLNGKLAYVNYVANDLKIQPSFEDARIGLSCFMEK